MDRTDNAMIEFRKFLELIPDPTFASIPDGRIVSANSAAAEMLGVALEDLIGRTVFEFVPRQEHPDLRARRERFFADQRADRTMGVDEPMHAIRSDGTKFPIEVTITLAELERGPVRIASVRDITERLRAEEERRHLEAMLASNHKARMESIGQLAGGIAHDFNNLLAVIGTSAEFLAEQVADDEVREDVEQIREASERAAALTRQLLVFSRKSPEDRRPVDANQLVLTLEKLLGRTLGTHVEIETKLDPELATVNADATQIEGAVLNLAINARDAMTDGGRLRIETSNVTLDQEYSESHPDSPEPGDYVRISVVDEGVGMDRETIERAFEPFFTTKDRMHGTGLGLATVYGTVTSHGGNVAITSVPGGGTTVSLHLPVSSETAVARERADVEEPRSGEGRRVVVVEDDDAVRRVIVRALTSKGYAVVDFDRGAPALELLQDPRQEVDLLLTDVVMPELQGDEVAERAKAIRPELPVLFMSGYSELMVERFESDRDAARVLEKPFSIERLLSEVQSSCERRTRVNSSSTQ